MFSIHITNKYNWLGNPDAGKMPVYMYVDYFRMYKPEESSTSTTDIIYEEITAENNLAIVFPNPANQKITVSFNQSGLRKNNITIHSIDGRRFIGLDQVLEKDLTIDISSLPVGLYFLTIKSCFEVQTIKFIRHI
jgi:hypothetical protein